MNRLSVLFCLLLCTLANAAADVRQDVDGIAAAIEQHYFDPARGAQVAESLRADARAGAFDSFSAGEALAAALTPRLRKIDRHFAVRWPGAQGRDGKRERVVEFDPARQGHGFRRVERLRGNLGYVELTFAADIDFDDASSPARRAADAALALVRDADAVIIDLRNNGGGAPAMVGYLVSAFVPADAKVYNTFYWPGGIETERPKVTYPTPMLTVPLFLLTNRGTASAAESIAFTLQTAQRAIVVGDRTAGAANPGQMFDTPQGYAVFVSTGSPRNPINGRNWEGEGVKPDVEAGNEDALLRARRLALTKVLAGAIAGASRKDAQAALDSLDSAR